MAEPGQEGQPRKWVPLESAKDTRKDTHDERGPPFKFSMPALSVPRVSEQTASANAADTSSSTLPQERKFSDSILNLFGKVTPSEPASQDSSILSLSAATVANSASAAAPLLSSVGSFIKSTSTAVSALPTQALQGTSASSDALKNNTAHIIDYEGLEEPSEDFRVQVFDYPKFIEQFKSRPAEPVAKYVRSFLKEYNRHAPSEVEDQTRILHDFFAFINIKMRQCNPWHAMLLDPNEERAYYRFEMASDAMEKLVTTKLWHLIYPPVSVIQSPEKEADLLKDRLLDQRIFYLSWITPAQLDLPIPADWQGPWIDAGTPVSSPPADVNKSLPPGPDSAQNDESLDEARQHESSANTSTHEAAGNTPIETSQATSSTAEATPSETTGAKSAEATNATPAEATGVTSTKTTSATPAEATGTTPAEAPETIPQEPSSPKSGEAKANASQDHQTTSAEPSDTPKKPSYVEANRLLELSIDELRRVQDYRSPRDKMVCILNCCKGIYALIRSVARDEGADTFIPFLVYVVLKARPAHIHSDMQYIQRFRNQARLAGESGYYFSSLFGALAFIEAIDDTTLTGVTRTEFSENVAKRLRAYEEDILRRLEDTRLDDPPEEPQAPNSWFSKIGGAIGSIHGTGPSAATPAAQQQPPASEPTLQQAPQPQIDTSYEAYVPRRKKKAEVSLEQRSQDRQRTIDQMQAIFPSTDRSNLAAALDGAYGDVHKAIEELLKQ